jgi:hypothetical protein
MCIKSFICVLNLFAFASQVSTAYSATLTLEIPDAFCGKTKFSANFDKSITILDPQVNANGGCSYINGADLLAGLGVCKLLGKNYIMVGEFEVIAFDSTRGDKVPRVVNLNPDTGAFIGDYISENYGGRKPTQYNRAIKRITCQDVRLVTEVGSS